MTDVPLALDAVTVRFGGRVVLDRLTLEVPRAAVFALLGANGAGKTTAIACLLGLLRPDEGVARLFGADAWRSRTAALARVGVVPEEPDIPLGLTPRALAELSAALYPRWDRAGFDARLGRLGIGPGVPIERLSRGQKTQVLLASAMAGGPEALVLDDPTLGLDPLARREVLEEIIGDLADRDTTTLLTTNDLTAVEGIATHIGILRHGRLVVGGDLEALKADDKLWRRPARSLEELFTDVQKGRAA
jgi:ABC-2 type transport system ATP-binding protein